MECSPRKCIKDMAKKYKLRDFFSVELKGEMIVGPATIELEDAQAALEAHKLEEIPADDKPSKKKDKAEK